MKPKDAAPKFLGALAGILVGHKQDPGQLEYSKRVELDGIRTGNRGDVVCIDFMCDGCFAHDPFPSGRVVTAVFYDNWDVSLQCYHLGETHLRPKNLLEYAKYAQAAEDKK